MDRIDLLKVPKEKLQEIAEQFDIDIKGKTIVEIRKKIYESLDRDDLRELTSEYIYGGRSSIYWYKYAPIDGVTEVPINQDNIKRVVKHLCDNGDPFEGAINQELIKIPQIVSARFLDNSKVWLLFAAKGRVKGDFVNYTYHTYISTDFANCVIRLDDNIMEFRSTMNFAKKSANYFINALNQDNSYRHDITFKMITDTDLLNLQNELDARMRSYKGVDQTGKYHSREITAHKEDDLICINGFTQDKANLGSPISRLIFKSPINSNNEIVIRVNTQFGCISILSKYVTEADIDFVYDTLKNINVIG